MTNMLLMYIFWESVTCPPVIIMQLSGLRLDIKIYVSHNFSVISSSILLKVLSTYTHVWLTYVTNFMLDTTNKSFHYPIQQLSLWIMWHVLNCDKQKFLSRHSTKWANRTIIKVYLKCLLLLVLLLNPVTKIVTNNCD